MLNFFVRFSHVTHTRGDIYKIFIERCNTTIKKHSFIFRTVHVWNHLSVDTKNSESLNIFKNSIDSELNHLMFDFDEWVEYQTVQILIFFECLISMIGYMNIYSILYIYVFYSFLWTKNSVLPLLSCCWLFYLVFFSLINSLCYNTI